MFSWIIRQIKKNDLLPKISDTERAALEAGTVWIEGNLFSGKPRFKKILEEPYAKLTEEEREFIEGPVEEVCRMVNDMEVRKSKKLPEEVWEFLGKHSFFGLTIPKKYNGKGFSALATSNILGRLATRNMMLNVVVTIANSIGPGELLVEYGLEEQKDYYLPRLVSGEEIPAFALTEVKAGSDAGSLSSSGVVFRGEDEKLYIRLNWQKRYITMAPIATLAGLAFRLYDPENLLGKGEDLGITCALVDTSLPGVNAGRYHDPLGNAFPNGPICGENVVIPVDKIIGGAEYAGGGWKMLMEALSAGRAVSLPASATDGTKAIARGVGAYSLLREQFGLPIGKLEGVREPLARLTGWAYMLEGSRTFTCSSLDNGNSPAIVSAIVKYHHSEIGRKVVNEAMDVLGGKGICLGPNNPIYAGYLGAPVAITVEGANILTRTLIIFGQGLIRCHPYMYKQVQALEQENPAAFGKALMGHIKFVIGNQFRALFLSLSRGWLASRPVSGPTARYYQKLSWASACFSCLVDFAAVTMGPALKKKGMIGGRFADILSWMYIGTATLRRFEAEGRIKEDLPLVHWCLQYCLWNIQTAFEGVLANLKVPLFGNLPLKPLLLWFRLNPIGMAPDDQWSNKIVDIMQQEGEQRNRLTGRVLPSASEDEPFAILERAFSLVHQAAPVTAKIKRAIRQKQLPKKRVENLLEEAQKLDIITAQEMELLQELEKVRWDVIKVDDYSWEEYSGSTITTQTEQPTENLVKQ